MLLGAIEGFEEGGDVALVGVGLGGEAGFVDAVVDEVVDPGVVFFDLGTEVFRVEVDFAVLLLDEVVELALLSVPDFTIWLWGDERRTSDPSILRISLLSLLTIVFVFLSYSTGTVYLPS